MARFWVHRCWHFSRYCGHRGLGRPGRLIPGIRHEHAGARTCGTLTCVSAPDRGGPIVTGVGDIGMPCGETGPDTQGGDDTARASGRPDTRPPAALPLAASRAAALAVAQAGPGSPPSAPCAAVVPPAGRARAGPVMWRSPSTTGPDPEPPRCSSRRWPSARSGPLSSCSAPWWPAAPQLAAEIAAAGHEIGVHGWDHRYLPARPGGVLGDLARARDAVAAATGAGPGSSGRPTACSAGPVAGRRQEAGADPGAVGRLGPGVGAGRNPGLGIRRGGGRSERRAQPCCCTTPAAPRRRAPPAPPSARSPGCSTNAAGAPSGSAPWPITASEGTGSPPPRDPPDRLADRDPGLGSPSAGRRRPQLA